MIIAGFVLTGLAALVHVYIWVLESLIWTGPRARATFGIRSDDEAQLTKALAFNQGFYNLFLAIAVFAGIVVFAAGAPEVGATLVFVGAGSMVAAGSLLTPGTQIPAGVLAAGSPAQVRKPLEGMAKFWVDSNPAYYADLAQRHRAGITRI